jgi:hypothetical protein
MECHGGNILTGERRRTLRKTFPIITLFTANPTWIDKYVNPYFRGERPANNSLSHDTATFCPNSELLLKLWIRYVVRLTLCVVIVFKYVFQYFSVELIARAVGNGAEVYRIWHYEDNM